MNCPDCGSKLAEQPSAAGVVVRCFKCGGFFLDADTANNLTAAELVNWRRISIDIMFLSGGRGVCPADGQELRKYVGEQVPMNVVVRRCVRCGKWWFPGDNLFRFKPALEAKKNYLRLWGLPINMGTLLPLLLVTVLAGGTVAGVRLIRQPQDTNVSATGQLTEFSGTYSGGGKALVVFKSKEPVDEVLYRSAGELLWKKVKPQQTNGYYVVNLEGLMDSSAYTVKILGREYGFAAN